MAKKMRGEEGGGDTWLNTYADMVTLLLTFFAVLLSMSSVDQEKFNAFIRSFSSLSPEVIEEIINPTAGDDVQGNDTSGDVDPGNPEASTSEAAVTQIISDMEKLYRSLKAYVEENNAQDAVDISKKDGVIYIRFSSAVFFEPDRYVLRPESQATMSFIGDGLKQYEDEIRMIGICGHTASTQWENSQIAWLLSGERAAVVAMFLQDEKEFDPKKLIVMGYSKNYPVGDNNTEEGRRKNRRVELVIIGEENDEDFDVYDALGEMYDTNNYPADGDVTDILLPKEDETNTTANSTATATSSTTVTATSSASTSVSQPPTNDTVPGGTDTGVSPYDG